ncbi:MAG: hypothetical protein AAGA03_09205 [Planctomycetota bacterium]
MKPLRFDASGSIDPELGITSRQISDLRPMLEQARTRFLETTGFQTADSAAETGGGGFYSLPPRQLADYESKRRDSLLGKIFTAANGLHDHIDAVVVVGSEQRLLGSQALMAACCDPHHNELPRGQRGSKPRMYFASAPFDNDGIQSLLSRLAIGGIGPSDAVHRWAVVWLDDANDAAGKLQTIALLEALSASLGDQADSWLPRLNLSIHGECLSIDGAAEGLARDVRFTFPVDWPIAQSVLSCSSLLHAAFLGLDCMKLLEGAVAINQQFESAEFPENLPLQWAAVQHLQTRHHNCHRRLMLWEPSLDQVGQWYGNLLSDVLGVELIRVPRGGPEVASAGSPCVQWLVDHCRADPVKISDSVPDDPDGRTSLSLDDRRGEAIRAFQVQHRLQGMGVSNLHLPTIDTYVLGQLFQLLMIATAMESQLRRVPSS